jgi:hypothetical protein
MTNDLWEVRTLHGGLSAELRGREKPALVLVQGSERVRVELADVKVVVAGIADAAADWPRCWRLEETEMNRVAPQFGSRCLSEIADAK